jgi:hypothetical protein
MGRFGFGQEEPTLVGRPPREWRSRDQGTRDLRAQDRELTPAARRSLVALGVAIFVGVGVTCAVWGTRDGTQLLPEPIHDWVVVGAPLLALLGTIAFLAIASRCGPTPAHRRVAAAGLALVFVLLVGAGVFVYWFLYVWRPFDGWTF